MKYRAVGDTSYIDSKEPNMPNRFRNFSDEDLDAARDAEMDDLHDECLRREQEEQAEWWHDEQERRLEDDQYVDPR